MYITSKIFGGARSMFHATVPRSALILGFENINGLNKRTFFVLLKQFNKERPITISRNQSLSRKAVAGSSVRATSSADFLENRSSRVVLNNGRPATTQRTQFPPPSSSLATKSAAPSRLPPDVTLDFLTIGNDKRK